MKDRVTIRVKSGRGGDGCVSFRREKFIPRGGPDGGDGGRGGHVFIRAREKTPSLEKIRNRAVFRSGNGHPGEGSRKNGRHGDDVFIDVPPGTSVLDVDTSSIIGELIQPGDKLQVAAGGAGGRGNCHFATPENRVPRENEAGFEGSERNIELRFSFPADVAVIGFPSSGKSAIVSRLTNSRTKSAEYPFTTRSIHVGVININPHTALKIIDTPALVEGAHEGKGAGNSFLMHLHRVSTVLFVLDPTGVAGDTPERQLEVLREEIRKFDPAYSGKKAVIAINKIDIAGDETAAIEEQAEGAPVVSISTETGKGLDELTELLSLAADPDGEYKGRM